MLPADIDDIALALQMRANYIETGNVVLTRNDAIQSKQHKIIKALSQEQMDLVAQLRNTAERLSLGRLILVSNF